jgi:hypothetical protein
VKVKNQTKLVLNNRIALFLCLFFLIISIIFSLIFDGTVDAYDSVMHYLISRWAFKHPVNFIDHWGKPLFTLFSAPVSQFGFVGIKIFNSIVASVTAYLTFKVAKKLNLRFSWLAIIFIFFAPLYFILIFSGLTEHFFALLVIAGLYLLLINKICLSAVIISFLPFARSEGLIILGVYLLFFLFKRNYKIIVFLFTGHIVYGIIGWLTYYHDFLWIFNKIPYAKLSSVYGSGDFFHYFREMKRVVGYPIYTLIFMGIGYLIITAFIKKVRERVFFMEEVFLIFGAFGAFFMAHTLFWYLGIFNSMGLVRVLIDIMPLMILVALRGFNTLFFEWKPKFHRKLMFLSGLYVFAILLYPFIKAPGSINWFGDFKLDSTQEIVMKSATLINNSYPENKYFYELPYLSLALDVDHFDVAKHDQIYMIKYPERFSEKSLVIWDNSLSPISGITLDTIENMPYLKQVANYKNAGVSNFELVLFEFCPNAKAVDMQKTGK